MSQLSLSWLGLGHIAASPWLLLLLTGGSCLLAYILTQVSPVFENSRRLRCFPQPPKRNWLLGHLGLVSVAVKWAWGVRVEGIVRILE